MSEILKMCLLMDCEMMLFPRCSFFLFKVVLFPLCNEHLFVEVDV